MIMKNSDNILQNIAEKLSGLFSTNRTDDTYYSKRPDVVRRPTDYLSRRARDAVRYHKGVEAAKLFELPPSKRNFGKAVSDAKVYLNPISSFVVKYRRLISTVCILAMVFWAVFAGVNYGKKLFNDQTLFIANEQETGNITISERLVTSDEMSEKVVYFLLLGVDDSELLTDCIWIMCYDIAANQANVMQVPRDTYVGKRSATGKINGVYSMPETAKVCEACGYAPESDEISDGCHTVCGNKLTKVKESNISSLIRYINKHLGLPIDHFVTFTFRGFARIVDAMGGIDITLEKGIHDKAITLSSGAHHLDGWQAVDYMRHRKSYKEGDIGRVKGQRIMINALMEKALNMELTEMLGLITQCSGCFQTDLAPADITRYATTARSLDVSKLDMFTMPGYDHWVKPNPSYYVCSEKETAAVINEKMLPYGLPDGSYVTEETINFPDVVDKFSSSDTTRKTKTTAEEYTTSKTKTTTTTTEEYTTSKTKTTTEHHTTTTTTKTTTTTTTTPAPTTAPTTAPTAAPTTEPTFETRIEEYVGSDTLGTVFSYRNAG